MTSSLFSSMKNMSSFSKSLNDQCYVLLNPKSECHAELRSLVRKVNNQLWTNHKNSREYLFGADVYTVVILGLFASIIIVLMVRAIKPTETLDDQVTLLLSSMRVRVEWEENARERKKLREAKKTAQKWLNDIKNRSVRKLSYRKARSTSDSETNDRNFSIHSVPIGSYSSLRPKPVCRARSYTGYLPEIVVTDEPHPPTPKQQDSLESQRNLSRQSSVFTYDGVSQMSFDTDREDVFGDCEIGISP